MPRKFRLGVGRKNEFRKKRALKLSRLKASTNLVVSTPRRSVQIPPFSALSARMLSLPAGVFACIVYYSRHCFTFFYVELDSNAS